MTGESENEMSTNEKAQNLRKALKGLGYGARAVSVRVDSYSMGATIIVTVRDAGVDFAAVALLSRQLCERIDRCSYTGEILSGGNTYVEVKHSGEVLEAITTPIAALLSDVPGEVVTVGGYNVFRSDREQNFWHASKPGSDALDVYCYGKDFCARQLAQLGVRVASRAS